MPMVIGPKSIVAPEEERPALLRIRHLAEDRLDCSFKLVGPGGESVLLPTTFVHLLNDLALCLGRGQAVMLAPLDRYLTTQQAAVLLNVSRPYLVQLLDRGEMPYERLRSHRRIRFEDLMEYKKRREEDREKALDELTRLSEEFGMYDLPARDHPQS